MKDLNMKKFLILALTTFAIQTQAQAQTPATAVQPLAQATRFERMQLVLEDLCKANRTTLDCGVEIYKVQFSGSEKLWSRAIKRALVSEYSSALNATRVPKTYDQVVQKYQDVAEAVGFRPDQLMAMNQWENLQEAVSNDVMDESAVKIYAGHISGQFSVDHVFVAFVDTDNQELIIFRGGYSE